MGIVLNPAFLIVFGVAGFLFLLDGQIVKTEVVHQD